MCLYVNVSYIGVCWQVLCICYFKGLSRDGHWKLAVAIKALIYFTGESLCNSLCVLYLSLSNKHKHYCSGSLSPVIAKKETVKTYCALLVQQQMADRGQCF